jgi:uncharacterized membrane protein
MEYVILALFYFLFPVLVLYLEPKFSIIKKIGGVVICFGMGLLIGNIGVIPDWTEDFRIGINYGIIPLALPLLLFALDIRKWIRMAGKTLLSLVLGLVSVVITVFLGYYLYRDVIPDIWQVSGVLTGYYSGGAAQAAAIHTAVGMKEDVFTVVYTYDIVVGAVTLLFLMTVAQRFFLLFMQPYKPAKNVENEDTSEEHIERYESYNGIFRRNIFPPLLFAFGLSVLIVGISLGISMLFFKGINEGFAIFMITTLGIAGSFIPSVRNIQKTFQTGIYLVMVFCVILASGADISIFFQLESVPILMYVILVVPGALLLHGLLSKIFKVDVDNFLIISVALSMSPPFVPAVAAALKNRDIILPGLIIGCLGFAIAFYLGYGIANLLH